MLTKVSLLAPVHAICYYLPLKWILVGRGSYLYVYDIEGSVVHREILFSVDTAHSIKVYTSNICVVCSQKTVIIYDLSVFKVLIELSNLDDLILDAYLASTSTTVPETLVVGYAHNFTDIYTWNKDGGEASHAARIQCASVSVLFSMSILQDQSNRISVITGSVFGTISRWTLSTHVHTNSSSSSSSSAIDPSYSIDYSVKGHEGVVFRIRWNSPLTLFATTSDDRTIRVWNGSTGELVMTGWGHTCRR
jgi:WD repeat-containing protein 6